MEGGRNKDLSQHGNIHESTSGERKYYGKLQPKLSQQGSHYLGRKMPNEGLVWKLQPAGDKGLRQRLK